MKVAVALETSVRAASVAIHAADEIREAVLSAERAHASDLLPRLEGLLAGVGATAGDIETVLVGTGPGSYTGLRVGIATALGLARGAEARLLGVPSFEVLARGVLADGEECAVLVDARAGELYVARYQRTADEIEARLEPRAVRPDEARALLADAPVIFGDENAARAAQLDDALRTRMRAGHEPRARDLLALGLARLATRGPMTPAEVEPLYLRPFAARARRR